MRDERVNEAVDLHYQLCRFREHWHNAKKEEVAKGGWRSLALAFNMK